MNSRPLCASRSIAGVLMNLLPIRQLIASANCWSVMMKRMLGFADVDEPAACGAASGASSSVTMAMTMERIFIPDKIMARAAL
ncbi:MAG: hypothetical protein FJ387_30850 [Verrucomicrobia bacterium]|nr:hypothetical protein [Verrucomicrobiota bacterium]